MPFQVGSYKPKDPNAAKREAIEKARAARTHAKPEDGAIMHYIPPSECVDRTRIVFDDSGSMAGQIENAKKGVVEYLRNCIPNQSAVAMHFMNTKSLLSDLTANLPKLSIDVQEAMLNSGGTPFFNTLKGALEAKPTLTRMVAFTDGAPTDQLKSEESDELQKDWSWGGTFEAWKTSADIIIKIAHSIGGEKCIPIDTVFFGDAYQQDNIKLLKYLSDNTGGFFLHFDPQKVNFAQAFKYLAPVNRLRLTDGSFRVALERGDVR
jgi:hypothetical protein